MSGPDPDRGARPPVYTLGADDPERRRLRQQSEELRAHSAWLLDRVAVAPGWSAIDLGCGPSGVLGLLSERVGPAGRVTGLEYDPANVALARDFVLERGLVNVEVVQGDASRTGLPSSSFDLVHARTLLINVPNPNEVVTEMARLARPGSWVAVMEPDVNFTFCHPPLAAWDRAQEIFAQSFRADGADPFIGRRLGELFWDAGLVDVGIQPRADAYPAGHSRRTVRPDLLRLMRPKIVSRGLATEDELVAIDREVRDHLANPRTLFVQLFFTAWGRKPAT